jgi:hypothetical protein
VHMYTQKRRSHMSEPHAAKSSVKEV